MAARDEPLLERELTRRRPDPCAQAVVGRGHDASLDPERPSDPLRDRRQRLSRAQRLRPDEVQAQVEVTELEPGLAAEPVDGLERAPGLVRASPAALVVVELCEGVDERV